VIQCCVPKTNGKPCSIPADRERNGFLYCHLHDPEGNNQRRKKERKEQRNEPHETFTVPYTYVVRDFTSRDNHPIAPLDGDSDE